MILAFTEEQKKDIEARGMTVAEVKLIVCKAAKALNWLVGTIKNIFDNMYKETLEEVKRVYAGTRVF